MRARPLALKFLAAVFVLIAVAMPLQVMVIYGHGTDEIFAALDKLTMLNWLVIGQALLCAGLVWRASPYVLFMVPAFVAIVAANNFFVGFYATDYSMWTANLSTLGLAVVNLPLLSPKIQSILFNPEKRWWLRAERKRISVPVTLEGTRHQVAKSETFDVSLSGAFVPHVHEVSVGDWISVRMKFGTFSQIRCQARVVRRAESKGEYPAGVGVQFMNMSWRDRRDLRRCLEK